MNNTFEEAASNAQYLASFVPDQSIDWVYNHSNKLIPDLLEIFTMNYAGQSPVTQDLLKEDWIAFHEMNKDRPDAKYLHFCHSQGTLHTRNALVEVPPEVQKRILVVAVAPAAVVPDEICFKSFNYGCLNDIVTYGELAYSGFLDPNECGTSITMDRTLEYRNQLIFLEPVPDPDHAVHSFQNRTYRDQIEKHIKEYINKNGVYE